VQTDVYIKDKSAMPSLLSAAEDGDVELVKELLKASADLNRKDEMGNTALHLAAKDRHDPASNSRRTEVLKALVKAKADVNARNVNGRTALHFAAMAHVVENVKILVAAGADVDARDYLLGATALHFAVESRDKSVIDALLVAEANVNLKNKKGESALEAMPKNLYDPALLEKMRERSENSPSTYEASSTMHEVVSGFKRKWMGLRYFYK